MAATVAGLCILLRLKMPQRSFLEWWVEYYEINGSAVAPVRIRISFIGFDTKTGQYMATVAVTVWWVRSMNAKPGQIDLGALGSTRMMCPIWQMEKNVLAALGRAVKKYKQLGKGEYGIMRFFHRLSLCCRKKKLLLSWPIWTANGWLARPVGDHPVGNGKSSRSSSSILQKKLCMVLPDVMSLTVHLMWMMQIR